MKMNALKKNFSRMGAELRAGKLNPRSSRFRNLPFTLDVSSGNDEEYFEILLNPERPVGLRFEILDIRPQDRHLLFLAQWKEENKEVSDRFLCGHDERFWFAATVPDNATTVSQAKERLKPDEVRDFQVKKKVKTKNRNRRKNAAFVRQGEWFFVPAPDLVVDDWLILRKEPLQRSGSKPHIAEFLYREGGVTVHVCREYPEGLTERAYRNLIQNQPDQKKLKWRVMSRDPKAYVKGRITHPDHKTIVLQDWHRVLLNREALSSAQTSPVVFLD